MSDKLVVAPVWDSAIRVFHWLLVLFIPLQWLLLEFEDPLEEWGIDALIWHARIGYSVLFLLCFRLLWGVWGTDTARFQQFIRAPKIVWRYARQLFQQNAPAQLGHNPLGGWMVLLLLLLLGMQVGTGLFAVEDIAFSGPLSALVSEDVAELLTELHEENFNILLAAIVLHIGAIIFYRFYKKQNLLSPMLRGQSLHINGVSNSPLSWRALCIAGSSALVFVAWLVWGYW